MYDALEIAEYVIQKCWDTDRAMNNLKLQKILYFIQAEFLVSTNRPCFSDEIEAWNFGPVIPSVYRKYKVYGSACIPFFKNNPIFSIKKSDMKMIDGIIDECSDYSTSALTDITCHQHPWMHTHVPYQQRVISQESIKQYFEE